MSTIQEKIAGYSHYMFRTVNYKEDKNPNYMRREQYGGIFKSQGLYRNTYMDNTRTNKGMDITYKEHEQDRQTDGCLKQLRTK